MDNPRVEPSPKWVRGYIGDELVVDSRAVLLVWEHPRYPVWYFPADDVMGGSLTPEPAAEIAGSMPKSSVLEGYRKVPWGAVERWYEEDVEVFIHPRDPYKRIDALASSRHAMATIDGVVVATTDRPTILYETGLPPRVYFPPDDAKMELLDRTASTTGCPYKGSASYWSAAVNGEIHTDVAWSYSDPLPESEAVRGLLSFYPDRANIELDGQPLT